MYSNSAIGNRLGARAAAARPPQAGPRGGAQLLRSATRLLRAMLQCVAADGYAATTVPRWRPRRGSRRTPSTRSSTTRPTASWSCATRESRELLARSWRPASIGWREAVRAGVRIYLAWWRDRPESSRAYLLELPSAGEDAQRQRREAHERFVAMFLALAARAREEEPGLPPVSEVAVRVMTGGQTELVAAEVAAGRLDRAGLARGRAGRRDRADAGRLTAYGGGRARGDHGFRGARPPVHGAVAARLDRRRG